VSTNFLLQADNLVNKSIHTALLSSVVLLFIFAESYAIGQLLTFRNILFLVILASPWIYYLVDVPPIIPIIIVSIIEFLLYIFLSKHVFTNAIEEEKRMVVYQYIYNNVLIMLIVLFAIMKVDWLWISLTILLLQYTLFKIAQIVHIKHIKYNWVRVSIMLLPIIILPIAWYSSEIITDDLNMMYSFKVFPILIAFVLVSLCISASRKTYLETIEKYKDI
jgi:hypothetical protein